MGDRMIGTLLSIDPSYLHIGYALFEGSNLKNYGSINLKGDTPYTRLKDLYDKLSDLPEPAQVVIELAPQITYQRSMKRGKALNTKELHKLHLATGAIILFFASRGVPVEAVDVLAWKGNQRKATTQVNAKHFYGVEANDHVCDAIMLGRYYLKQQTIERLWAGIEKVREDLRGTNVRTE